ncbi:ABC transporter permease [Paenibacillus qinlingensis]|uniref:ABC transport system permease protein n=1 Tax=Paenibacillus qinlingensis TaxID=1837343 RepID=A0ABU1NT28_9BACL|nr:ABC transporter permease [Paenibacillus qinlingensis]MDR6550157.1 putative ABC transport system permease protein [Paenibacillus qinlingensis]
MYFKLARNSVKRSFKDYLIYFLTLSFAVCIFYSFNSLEAQQAVLDMNQSSLDYLKRIAGIISIISVGVSFILGGLILYANNFLIKKRKKELGIYMTLGMKRRKISYILVVETFLIGCLSLGIGLILGIVVSQGSSKLIAELFNVDQSSYRFVISYAAMLKTCLYFGMIFISVILFNHIIVSKVKLIDLLNAAKKNEVLKIKHVSVSIVIFLVAAGVLAYAYQTVIHVGFDPTQSPFIFSLILGVIGTLLLFFGLGGFILYVLQKNRSFYLNKLNIFVLRQIHNKINTNFISVTMISLMLFITMLSLFVVLNYKANLDQSAKGLAPFAASASTGYIEKYAEIPNIQAAMAQLNVHFDNNEKYVFFNMYFLDAKLKTLTGSYLDEARNKDDIMLNRDITVVKLSDYNRIRALKAHNPIQLTDSEVLVVSNYGMFSEGFKRFLKNEKTLVLKQMNFRVVNQEAVAENILNTPDDPMFLYFIVPDRYTEGLSLSARGLDIEPQGEITKQFKAKYTDLFNTSFTRFGEIRGFTDEQSQMLIYGVSIFLTFLGVYIGLVFLLASAVVLALQQLVEANESVERYRMLRKIGATEGMINQTIFRQTFLYFFLPFVVAVMHSIVGVKVMNDFFEFHNRSAMSSSAAMLAFIVVIVYGGYFYTTYSGYKSIVKS